MPLSNLSMLEHALEQHTKSRPLKLLKPSHHKCYQSFFRCGMADIRWKQPTAEQLSSLRSKCCGGAMTGVDDLEKCMGDWYEIR